MDKRDIFRGCLIGGAIGDALGYEVEFDDWKDIEKRFGKDGIQELFCRDGAALISDDTQMTLFTAEGLIAGKNRKISEKNTLFDQYLPSIWKAYKDWYWTQECHGQKYQGDSWLCTLSDMRARRAPGNTCLNALAYGEEYPTTEEPCNNSKGCGSVMRVAPVGLFFDPALLETEYPMDLIDMLGAEAAAQTHGHPMGYIPAAALVHMINRIAYPWQEDKADLKDIIEETIDYVAALYADQEGISGFTEMMRRAVKLAESGLEDRSALKQLGEGWVADEALAVAVYSALKYKDDFKAAMCCAVNHDGDSDSTGSIAGNILGAYLGMDGIENAFDLSILELKEEIRMMADRLLETAMS